MNVGFIGLGRMGRPMAINLARADVDLVVFDSNPDASAGLLGLGAKVASSVADLAGTADVVFTSLPGPAQVEAVILGSGGILEHARPGLVLFDLSTSSASLAQRIDEAFRARGCAMLDAPVSGGPAGATSGELSLWVGGDREVYDRHEDLLRIIGKSPRHVGDIGMGSVTKLTNNLLGYMIMQSLAEAFSMACKAGMDPLDLWEALKPGLVGRRSPLDMLVAQFLPGKYEPPAFVLDGARKDVVLANDLAKELGVPLHIGALTLAEMNEALVKGYGKQDSRAFLKVQLERAGVTVAVDQERVDRAVRKFGQA
ncbi:NAD(P)-dependent oxidoreductase [Nocardia sp. CA2R105]|uniref:NAD(P)-dependent oxidoreductase n=1 Tax=Nocardia coffeae TaxID=2873381 RepID=UPI001CA74778|nr:NAD(P)-dependent oxidoreductase [Nocardia coffeae]MBY8858683.1 NAD(P)-dependent oxidoreductase [Nocardia coffeae]